MAFFLSPCFRLSGLSQELICLERFFIWKLESLYFILNFFRDWRQLCNFICSEECFSTCLLSCSDRSEHGFLSLVTEWKTQSGFIYCWVNTPKSLLLLLCSLNFNYLYVVWCKLHVLKDGLWPNGTRSSFLPEAYSAQSTCKCPLVVSFA